MGGGVEGNGPLVEADRCLRRQLRIVPSYPSLVTSMNGYGYELTTAPLTRSSLVTPITAS